MKITISYRFICYMENSEIRSKIHFRLYFEKIKKFLTIRNGCDKISKLLAIQKKSNNKNKIKKLLTRTARCDNLTKLSQRQQQNEP